MDLKISKTGRPFKVVWTETPEEALHNFLILEKYEQYLLKKRIKKF